MNINKYILQTFLFTHLIFAGCSKFRDPSLTYTYKTPQTQNEFQDTSLTGVGMDEKPIIEMTNLIRRELYKRVDAVLILKTNKLVYEEYFHGYTNAIPHNIYSCTKSITFILTGIAIDKGFLDSIDTPILSFFPEYTNLQNPDPRKNQITIRHLLNMSSGLDCEDWYGRTEDRMNKSGDDGVKFTLDLPMVNDPGTHGSYCTGGVAILGRILERKTGMSLDQFAETYLFGPLGFKEYQWEKANDGKLSGGVGLFLRPRDMAKIGLLMLNNGNWKGKQIVSQDWVKNSGENVIKLIGPYTGYGFLWWKQTFNKNGNILNTYFASGSGGQEIFVIPSEEMVLVFTQGNVNTGIGIQDIYMIKDYILPAIK